MAIFYADQNLAELPSEARLLAEVRVWLVTRLAERRRHDGLLEREHYLHNAKAIGRVLRGAHDRLPKTDFFGCVSEGEGGTMLSPDGIGWG